MSHIHEQIGKKNLTYLQEMKEQENFDKNKY